MLLQVCHQYLTALDLVANLPYVRCSFTMAFHDPIDAVSFPHFPSECFFGHSVWIEVLATL